MDVPKTQNPEKLFCSTSVSSTSIRANRVEEFKTVLDSILLGYTLVVFGLVKQ
jgi:hypothetical protein